MPRKTAFLYSDDFLSYHLSDSHPLQQRRLQMVYRMLEAYRAFTPDGPIDGLPPVAATEEEVRRVHTPDFVEAVHRAGTADTTPVSTAYLTRYGLGPGDTPAFPGMFEAAALYAGGTVEAARLVLSGQYDAAFNVAGGLHHAHPDHASGFCTFNDLAMGIHELLRGGLSRVVYVDIDAHHGDGVQACFYDDPRVLTISLHEGYGSFYPGTGYPGEIGEGAGKGYSLNVPYYPYTEDETWHQGFDAVIPDAFARFKPEAVVLQCGADAHWGDPLTHLMLTTGGWMQAVDKLLALSEGRPLVVTGGGGYNLRTVARLWTLLTARCASLELPNEVPAALAHEFGIPALEEREVPRPILNENTRHEAGSYARLQIETMRGLMREYPCDPK